MKPAVQSEARRRAMQFIVLLGIVSLFADVTYEGARSIIGPFLETLHATGFEMGLVVGFGELCAASLRYFSGRIADRTRAYWTLAVSGYAVNLVAVPALAFAGSWQIAALFVIAERTGKALRGPARDVILSEATGEVGHGWGFGLHNAMDQVGAVLGPLWVALAIARYHSFGRAFLPLVIPAAAAVTALLIARALHPNAGQPPAAVAEQAIPGLFYRYIAIAGLLAFGYLDFAFFAYYWVAHRLVTGAAIPLLYALAMGFEGLISLAAGRWFDHYGVAMLSLGTAVSLLSLPLGFWAGPDMGTMAAVLAVLCWATGTGTQSACLRPAIAQVVTMHKRGTAFGTFNAVWGVLWFAGSAIMGLLLDHNVTALVVIGMSAQAASAVLFLTMRRPLAAARR